VSDAVFQPVADPGQIPAAARLEEGGCYLLELRSEEHLLGIIALQPGTQMF
jgi:hypothetical protein